MLRKAVVIITLRGDIVRVRANLWRCNVVIFRTAHFNGESLAWPDRGREITKRSNDIPRPEIYIQPSEFYRPPTKCSRFPLIPRRRHLYDGRFPLLNVTRCNARLNHPPNSFLPIDRDDFYDSHGPLTIIKPCRYLSFGCCERNATRGERTNPRRERDSPLFVRL